MDLALPDPAALGCPSFLQTSPSLLLPPPTGADQTLPQDIPLQTPDGPERTKQLHIITRSAFAFAEMFAIQPGRHCVEGQTASAVLPD